MRSHLGGSCSIPELGRRLGIPMVYSSLPSSNRGRRVLFVGLLAASIPIASPLPAIGPTSLRLPLVSGVDSKATGDRQPQSAPTASSVEGLFESFQQRKTAAQTSSHVTLSAPVAAVAGQTESQRWLRSSSSSAAQQVAQRLIVQSSDEYAVGAWASAETSAWERFDGQPKALKLQLVNRARTAIATINCQRWRTSKSPAPPSARHETLEVTMEWSTVIRCVA